MQPIWTKQLNRLLISIIIASFIFYISMVFAMTLLTDSQIENFAKTNGPEVAKRLNDWNRLIKSNQDKTAEKKLELVNQFFNRFKFVSDIVFVGKSDYWMTPTEFIINGAGDCEDFSIAKYFTLLALGIPMQDLRIMYVKALKFDQAHMVLTYYKTPGAEPLVLDNLTPKIKKASERPDLLPVYSFNGEGLWINKIRGQTNKVGSSKHLSKWKTMLNRMHLKGNTP